MADISFAPAWKTGRFTHNQISTLAMLSRQKHEGLAMAVYRLFKNEAFEPEAISSMTRAYADVCQTLGLNDGDHLQAENFPDKNVVAKKVIEFAQRGARDPVRLRTCVLQALRGLAQPAADQRLPNF